MHADMQKPGAVSAAEKAELLKGAVIESWKPEEAHALFEALEADNWAPWLAASEESIAGRAVVFPAGQLVMKDANGNMLASLSLNQIYWDGEVNHLPTWDEVAGDPTDYSTTYDPEGNTLVLLSMNVADGYKGLQLPSLMIDHAVSVAHQLGVTHLIGSFRPSGFGEVKKGGPFDFEEYCSMQQYNTDKPVDPWLRSLSWKGMEMMAVDSNAMTVTVPLFEFDQYQQIYHAGDWRQTALGEWECGEVGSWKVDEQAGTATYKESNVWGSLPLA